MSKILRWIPAVTIMSIIYLASATPSSDIPSYGIWDTLVKKGGHFTGYALLALAIGYGFKFENNKIWLAWLIALLYAMGDEYHQSFTPGRHSSLVDVLLFDGGGAAIGLGGRTLWRKLRPPRPG